MLTEIKPIEHFKDLVGSAIKHQKVKTNELAEFYLSNLLENFLFSERLSTEPLATTYLKAMGADRELQTHLMKQLGDFSLFTSGFFSDSLKRKVVDIDYYMAMGSASYGYLAGVHRVDRAHDALSPLFSELSRKFGSFADVLSEVSERCRLNSSKDILRVYERWIRTKSRQAERILREIGIEPFDVSTKPIQ